MKGATIKVAPERLGVTPSFGPPRLSGNNPVSETLFRIYTSMSAWPMKGFAAIEAARDRVMEFVRGHNTRHQHSAIRVVTPAARQCREDPAVRASCHAVHRAAREKHPAGRSGRGAADNPPAPSGLTPHDRSCLEQVRAPREHLIIREKHRHDVAAMWVFCKLAPAFKTIADFRRDNGPAIIGACRAFVRLCRDAGLFAARRVARAGSKVQAAAGRTQVMGNREIAKDAARRDDEGRTTLVAGLLAGGLKLSDGDGHRDVP